MPTEPVVAAEAWGSPIAVAWAAFAAGEVRLEVEPEAALPITSRSRLGRIGDVGAFAEVVDHCQWRAAARPWGAARANSTASTVYGSKAQRVDEAGPPCARARAATLRSR